MPSFRLARPSARRTAAILLAAAALPLGACGTDPGKISVSDAPAASAPDPANTPDPADSPGTPATGDLTEVPAIDGTEEIPADWVDFDDPSGVSLRHPESWEAVEASAGPILVFVDPPTASEFRRNINITQMPAPAGGLDAYNRISIDELDGLPGATRGELLDAVISGEPAGQLTYEIPGNGMTIRALGVWVVHSDGVWLATYTAPSSDFDRDAADAALVLASLQFPG